MASTLAPARQQRTGLRAHNPPLVAELTAEASPFGLQGLARGSLQVLKPDSLHRLAVLLAVQGSPDEIRDPAFAATLLQQHPDWVEEYQVVHLIERSLWIQGHADLVMTLVRNPSQIPDSPPPEILQTLTQAYLQHPQATVWYGVPLFGEDKTAQGLPIPVTAAQVRDEAARRIQAAQLHALRWGWAYRAGLQSLKTSGRAWRQVQRTSARIAAIPHAWNATFRRARRQARNRARAEFNAHREYCKSGRQIPVATARPQSWLDRWALTSLESALLIDELVSPTTPTSALVPMLMLKVALIAPLTLVSCDPFLFLELPDESGKLRHLGHWYWQEHPDGSRTLHLHTA